MYNMWMLLTLLLLGVLLFQAATERIRTDNLIKESCGPKTINDKAVQDFLSNFTLNNSLVEVSK